ncbi:MAG TPA: hypothetical protein VG733_00985 [Chthoniobacteraceae bacterium]|nr:hypothetical protein [Chthoniobacteraceae bacterium]
MINDDFSDRLSPIMVKELRRGLRSGVFVTVFLFVQALMIFSVSLRVLAMGNGFARPVAEGLYWVIIGALLLVVLPCRGLNAHQGEVKSNTMELLLFSGFPVSEVIYGKWKAIVAQTILLMSTVLPYAVLRYFIGGVDLVNDLELISVLFFLSLLFTGFAVLLSSFTSIIARLCLYGVTLLFTFGVMTEVSNVGHVLLVVCLICFNAVVAVTIFRLGPAGRKRAP